MTLSRKQHVANVMPVTLAPGTATLLLATSPSEQQVIVGSDDNSVDPALELRSPVDVMMESLYSTIAL